MVSHVSFGLTFVTTDSLPSMLRRCHHVRFRTSGRGVESLTGRVSLSLVKVYDSSQHGFGWSVELRDYVRILKTVLDSSCPIMPQPRAGVGKWDSPKIRGTFLGVPTIRILLFRVLYSGPLVSETPKSCIGLGVGHHISVFYPVVLSPRDSKTP